MKKRSLTLIEVVISFVLTTILASVLFFYFRHSVSLKRELIERREAISAKAKLFERLTKCFNAIKSDGGRAPFYTQDGQIFFTFDYGIDLEKAFCDTLKGKLFLDEDRLILRVSPLEGDLFREEILMDNVEEFSFHFDGKSFWSSDQSEPPFIMHLNVNDASYAFFFPLTEGILLK